MLSAKIASRSLPKRRARTILTIAAVFLGVALLVGINMATASALGEFDNYINKFWGATDIVVTYGTEAPFYPNQTLSKVFIDPLVRHATQRLNWLGAIGNSASNTTFFMVGVDPTTDFDYATFNITGSSRVSFGDAVVDNILAEKYGLSVDSTFEIF